ncbi:MAG: hypothetical protein OXI24_18675 [Candidatus Poribacteria bacterium]|nr:hypothetical protein [Candidatus Poribacteria bacterium]
MIYRGITTGLNDAFIIDNQTKEALIAEDPRSADILKPVLRGRDIQRFKAEWKGCWLIATFPPLNLNIDDYPAVKSYLLSFGKQRLEQSGKRLSNGMQSRKKTSNAWFEIQDTCAYHEQFLKEKLLWMDLTNQGRFAYVSEPMFAMDTTFMMGGNSLKYLCAILNNRLTSWFMSTQALTSGMGTARWKQFTVERIPVPHISMEEQVPIITVVDRILLSKSIGIDTSTLELEIDSLIYELYGLTPEEILLLKERS